MRNTNRPTRLLGVAMAATVLVSIVSGCTSTSPAGSASSGSSTPGAYPSLLSDKYKGQSITFWGWDPLTFNRPLEQYVQRVAGVTTASRQIPATSIQNQIKLAAQAGTLPDVFKDPNTQDLPALVQVGAAKDITSLVKPYKKYLSDAAWKSCTLHGKIYCLPVNSPAGGMFYRADVLKKYGIDPESLTTWSAFEKASSKLASESGGKNYLLGMKSALTSSLLTAIINQNHAVLIDQDNRVKISPDSAQWQTVMKTIHSLVSNVKGKDVTEWTPPWYQAIKDGSIASFPEGTWFPETIQQQAPDTKATWTFTPYPASTDGGDRYPTLGSSIIVINPKSAKAGAAFELAKAWSIDPQGAVGIGLQQLGISVVSTAALNSSYVNSPQPLFAHSQKYWLDATEAYLKISFTPPAALGSTQAMGIFGTDLPKFIAGESSDAFLSRVAADIRKQVNGAH